MTISDKHLKVHFIAGTPNPQQLVWLAAHRDYAEELSIVDSPSAKQPKTEKEAGDILPGMLLNKGHFGPLEHPQMTFEICGFSQPIMTQLRTHRIGATFDYTSGRYTSQRFLDLADLYAQLSPDDWESWGCRDLTPAARKVLEASERVFYARPPGDYTDRKGKRFTITEGSYLDSHRHFVETACIYADKVRVEGYSEETARGCLATDYRPGGVVSFNARSLMHIFDMRSKADAQLEIQHICNLLFEPFQEFMPEVAAWYLKHRWGKNKIAP